MTIFTRIFLSTATILAVALMYFVSLEEDATTKQYREATEEPLVDEAYLLAAIVAEQMARTGELVPAGFREALGNAGSEILQAKIYNLDKEFIDTRILITDIAGLVRFDSLGELEGSDFSAWVDVSRARQGLYGARTSWDEALECTTMYISAPVRTGHVIQGVVTVAKPNCTADQLIGAAQRSTRRLGIVILALTLLASFITSLFITRPLAKLTAYARDVRDGKTAKIPKLPAGEIRALGEALEEMRATLDGKKYIEGYTKALAHELKSPLTAIRGSGELLQEDLPVEQRDRFVANILAEGERMGSLVEKLVSLSALQAGSLRDMSESIAIGALVERCAADLGPMAQVRQITVKCEIENNELTVLGSAIWLSEAVSNLMTNAIEFGPPGSEVVTAVRAEGSMIIIEVRDSGPGIPEWAVDRVWDEFFSLPRPDSKRKSSGLGLALVREIALRHGGEIRLSNLAGGGACATLTIPNTSAN